MCTSASEQINRFTETLTHHVHDLLQGQSELENNGVRLIGHRSLQSFVLCHQVVDESPLVGTAEDHQNILEFQTHTLFLYCKKQPAISKVCSHSVEQMARHSGRKVFTFFLFYEYCAFLFSMMWLLRVPLKLKGK